ncbi:Pdi1 protein disulfide-isomerase [Scheffersomyces amazonensis]|uniref:Pdi1 protein disulfide-isomerase n=1 Tax=Scheffersomyces amazonensis TaxID=1078765 RepID=UPI00315D6FCA
MKFSCLLVLVLADTLSMAYASDYSMLYKPVPVSESESEYYATRSISYATGSVSANGLPASRKVNSFIHYSGIERVPMIEDPFQNLSAIADPNSAVVKLTSTNYTSFLEEYPLVLIEFYTPWCTTCKMLGSEYSKAADLLNETNPNIKLAQVDCDEEQKLCLEHEIGIYPTLKVSKSNIAEYTEWNHMRTAQTISRYMIKKSLPAVITFETYELLDNYIQTESEPFVILVNPIHDERLNDVFFKFAEMENLHYSFISVADKTHIAQLNNKVNANLSDKRISLILIHPGEFDDVREFNFNNIQEINSNSLHKFVSKAAIPYVIEDISPEITNYMRSSMLPIAQYFYKTSEQKDIAMKEFRRLAKKYDSQILFTVFKGSRMSRIDMDLDILPAFIIQAERKPNQRSNSFHRMNQYEYLNGPPFAKIESFIEDFMNKKLYISESLPTKEEVAANPIVKLVGYNYNEMIRDMSKDVFVAYNDALCRYCNDFIPIWKKLASIYNSNKPNAKVIIAVINPFMNDIDSKARLYNRGLTLLFYPANGEIDEITGLRVPILYEGDKDLESLVEFIKENGGLGIDGRVLQNIKAVQGSILPKFLNFQWFKFPFFINP